MYKKQRMHKGSCVRNPQQINKQEQPAMST